MSDEFEEFDAQVAAVQAKHAARFGAAGRGPELEARVAALEADLAEIHTVLLSAARDVRPSETREDTPTPLLARQVASLARSTMAALDEARLCLLAEAGDPRGAEGLHGRWERRADRWCLVDGMGVPTHFVKRAVNQGADSTVLRWSNNGTWWPHAPAGLTIREAMRWVEREVGL